MGTSVATEVIRDRAYPRSPVLENLLYVWSGSILRTVALVVRRAARRHLLDPRSPAFRRHAAIGRSLEEYALLYPLLDITTTLDPRFNVPYRFGAIFLAEPFPGGRGVPDLAVTLLEKGIAARPEVASTTRMSGSCTTGGSADYKAASHGFCARARCPTPRGSCAHWRRPRLTEGGDRGGSRLLWQQLRQTGTTTGCGRMRNCASPSWMRSTRSTGWKRGCAEFRRALRKAAGLLGWRWRRSGSPAAIAGRPVG